MQVPVIGIDLGTTYSAVATMNVGGKPEMIENSEGDKFTPSVIWFNGNQKLVGQIGINSGKPQSLERWFKKRMGDINWISQEHNGQAYSAVDLSAMVLKKIVQDAEQVGSKITKAVVTVPAYFSEIQRKATQDAAKLAGLQTLALINEPTAAALAFASTGRVSGNCLVYDFGGGTFDVSVVEIKSGDAISVLSSEGDNDLGGYNIDQDLAELIDAEFRSSHGVSMLQGGPADRHTIVQAAEKIKRDLSLVSDIRDFPLLNSEGQSIVFSITREDFEKVINARLRQTEMLIDLVLQDTELKPNDIEHVLLVGGSTRIPAVQEMLQRKFGKPPVKSINPDQAVALGAALKAGQLLAKSGEIDMPVDVIEALKATKVQDVTNHSYGTIAVENEYGVEQLRNTIIIPKNSQIPCEFTDVFSTIHDNQDCINVKITQGEDRDPRFVQIIHETEMSLPPNRVRGQELRITYSYNSNQRMDCEVLDVTSGETLMINLDLMGEGRIVPSISESIFDDLVIE